MLLRLGLPEGVRSPTPSMAHSKSFLFLMGGSVVFALLPFIILWTEQSFGSLPSHDQWLSQRVNHGPWRWEAENLTIGYPLIVLGVGTVVYSISRSWGRHEILPLLQGVGLLIFQAGAVY